MSGKPRRKAMQDVATELMWRALLRDPAVEWQQLSVITRGIADEILRRVERSRETGGPPQIVAAPGRTIYEAISMTIGAHPKERRRVAEAVDELVQNRWAVIDGTRFMAYFPDLGAERPAHAVRSAFSGEANVASSQETGVGSRGEEKRVEETRGEVARDWMVTRGVDMGIRSELKKHEIVFTELLGPSWSKVVNWVFDFAEAIGKPTSHVVECMCRGFWRNQKAKLAGYPLSFLVTNPRQFYDEGLRDMLTSETFDDEEHPL